MNLKSSQSGFSLVELMVVVAIIGILATMSVGAIQKQIAKSRQSEAKTNLASIYSAEKTFNAEFGAFTSQFAAAGIDFEGNLRYNVGFDTDLAPPAGYTGVAATGKSAVDVCVAGATCTMIPTNGVTPAAGSLPANSDITATTFNAGAGAAIYSSVVDQWQMNQNKVLTNVNDGINVAAESGGAESK